MESIEHPRKIDDYILGPILGKGFFGHVRTATKMGEDVPNYAIKYMKLDNPNTKPALLQSLQQECVLRKLNHPNILRIYSASPKGIYERFKGNEVKSTPVTYIVLQLARTGDLFDFIASSGGLSERVARFYFNQVLNAVDYLHSQGITHRDIKPENILLDENYNALVTDFGLSRKLSEVGFTTVNPSNRVGTERCMSPELFAGKMHSPVKDDLFALGYLLFMLVAQHPPFLSPSTASEHYRLLKENRVKEYWKAMDLLHASSWCTDEFRHLVTIMLNFDMSIRPSISEIKSHPWTTGELPCDAEVIGEFERRQSSAIEYQKKEAEIRKQRRIIQNKSVKVPCFGPHNPIREGWNITSSDQDTVPEKKIELFGTLSNHKPTLLMSQENLKTIEAVLLSYFTMTNNIRVNEKKYKV